MSGFTPCHAFAVPEWPAEDCRIVVDQVVIDALRTLIPTSRDDSMRWVDPVFEQAAQGAYMTVGRPSLSNISSGWAVFSSMAALIDVTLA